MQHDVAGTATLGMAAVVVPPGGENDVLLLKIDPSAGPLNMPLTIRATTERGGEPLTAEAEAELTLLDAAAGP